MLRSQVYYCTIQIKSILFLTRAFLFYICQKRIQKSHFSSNGSQCSLPMHAELTDTELTLRLAQNDAAAFETLFHRYYRFLFTIASQYLKDPVLAEDALQDVYLKLWTHRDSLDASQSVKSYLATAMRHQVLNRLRDDKRAILRHIDHQSQLTAVDTTTEEQITL